MPNLKAAQYLPFNSIRQLDDNGQEFWFSRDLQLILEYAQWRNFQKVIERAMVACKNSNNSISIHFAEVSKNVDLGMDKSKKVKDFKLSRYACYLIVQNGDPRKNVIALGQTYFAIQTRKSEEIESFNALDENNRRLVVRNQISQTNQLLVRAAHRANIKTDKQFATFQNHGYRGLYGGLSVAGIHKHKKLKKNEKILDHMGSTELGANLFRITQTEARLTNENISNPLEANHIHFDVGQKVRGLMVTMNTGLPENLETPRTNINAIEREEISKIKKFKLPTMLDE